MRGDETTHSSERDARASGPSPTRRELLARVERALAANPGLREHLERGHGGDEAPVFPSFHVEVSADSVTRSLTYESAGFGIVLSVTSGGAVTLGTRMNRYGHARSASSRVFEARREGAWGDAAIVALAGRLRNARMAHRLPLSERSVAIIESLLPGDDVFEDPAFRGAPDGLSSMASQARSAMVGRSIASFLSRGMADLVDALCEGRGDFGPDACMAVAMVGRLAEPGRVADALRRIPFLRAALHPGHVPSDVPWIHVQALSDGRPPHEVVAALARRHLPDGTIPRPVALRSIGQVDPATPDLASTLSAIIAFHDAHPSHRSLDATETGCVHLLVEALHQVDEDGCLVMPTDMGVAHALLDGTGRMAPPPTHLRDAIASLRASIGFLALAAGAADPGAVTEDITVRTAFPPSCRHARLARVDREWHEGVTRLQADLGLARDAILARRIGGLDVEAYPHPARDTVTIDGVVARPLLSEEDYAEEGRRNSHCVGTYAGKAWTGRVIGFSLADPTGRSTLTYDVEARGDSVGIGARQHLGPRNGRPPASHVAAEATLRGLLSVDADALRRHAAEMATRKDLGPRHETAPADMTEAERARMAALHFRNVALWLGPATAAPGPHAWWADVTAALPHAVPRRTG